MTGLPQRTPREQREVERLGERIAQGVKLFAQRFPGYQIGTEAEPLWGNAWEALLACRPLYAEAARLAPTYLKINRGLDPKASLIVDPASLDPDMARRRREAFTSMAGSHYGVVLLDAADLAVPFALSMLAQAEFGVVIRPTREPDWFADTGRTSVGYDP